MINTSVTKSHSMKFCIGVLLGAVLMMLIDTNQLLTMQLLATTTTTTTSTTTTTTNLMPTTTTTTTPLSSSTSLRQTPTTMSTNQQTKKEGRNPYCDKLFSEIHAQQQSFLPSSSSLSSLEKSARQCASVWKKRNEISTYFLRNERYATDQEQYAAAILTEEFAFLHIWVNGDRSILEAIKDVMIWDNHEQYQQYIQYIQEQQQEEERNDDDNSNNNNSISNSNTHVRDNFDPQLPLTHSEIRKRKWIALVQDPISHFLNGWGIAEVKRVEDARARGHDDLASRIMDSWEVSLSSSNTNASESYDTRVYKFLQQVKAYVNKSSAVATPIDPYMHALPQTNFLMSDTGTLHENLAMVADVDEWAAVLKVIHFPSTSSTGEQQQQSNADETTDGVAGVIAPKTNEERKDDSFFVALPPSDIQSKYFPVDVERLSRTTLLELCDFLAMDYFLLSYTAPNSCLKKGGPLDFEQRRRTMSL